MVHLGDGSLLSGDPAAAAVRYDAALQHSPVSPKAHYNLASVLVADPETWTAAIVHYREASGRYETPAARLNGAALLQLAGSRAEAQALLQEGLSRSPDPYLANALALLYQQQGQPDSAIRWYQAALLADPSLSSVYSNLALLYHDYGRPAEAEQFIGASLEGRPSDAALINAIWHSLSTGQPAALPDPAAIRPEDALLSYNLGLYGLRDPRYAADRSRIKQLANSQAVPDAMLLDAYLMAIDDSALYARSRAEYLMQAFPRYAPLANRLLGVCYAGKEAPELARLYLGRAAEAGDSAAALQEAYLWMHLRERDSALYALTELRGTHPGMWKSCAKELAVLLLSVGEAVYAQTEWNLADLGPADWVRAGMLADSMKSYSVALEHFRQAIGMDSSWTVPYLEMARIYNRYGDPLAGETAGYGLQIEPESGALHLEAARAQLLQGWADQAVQSLAQAGSDEALLSRSLLLRADLALAKADTAAAIGYLDSLARRRPLFAEGLVRLGGLYARTAQADQGHALIAAAVTVNPASSGLWLAYARYARAWNQLEDAGYGAIKAIELSRTAQAKQAIAAEFAAEIRIAARSQD
jgi:predicted Zn-dependent protease